MCCGFFPYKISTVMSKVIEERYKHSYGRSFNRSVLLVSFSVTVIKISKYHFCRRFNLVREAKNDRQEEKIYLKLPFFIHNAIGMSSDT